MEGMTIQSIIIECQNGKEEALTILYELSVCKIRRQLMKLGMQYADIEDIVQETMLRVYAKLDQIRDPNCYSRWLFQVTKSVYVRYFNVGNRYLYNEVTENIIECRSYMLPLGHMDTIEIKREARVQISSLKKPVQEVLILKYIQELSEEEISIKMNIPKGTVKSRLYYAKQHFQG